MAEEKSVSRRTLLKGSLALAGAELLGFGESAKSGAAESTAAPATVARAIQPHNGQVKNGREFEQAAYPALPTEEPYDFHKVMVKEFNRSWRDPTAKPKPDEIEIPPQNWSLIYAAGAGPVLKQAVEEFRTHLSTSLQVQIAPAEKASLRGWPKERHAVIVGTRDQMPGCGQTLQGPKDYQIIVSPERIVICGYDERGAMFGLYNLESRMELRGGPFLPRDLNTVRHSLYPVRMTISGLGWMEWPDWYLRMLPRSGFDAIYASVYANPNGVGMSNPEWSTMHLQDPAKMHDLIRRAARYGLDVYAPIMYEIRGDASDEVALRKLVRDNAMEFPEIRGYVLLIEGFIYGGWWPPYSSSREESHSWIKQWMRGVAIATDEFHKINPKIEVIPWDYNIDFRPQAVDLKTFIIDQYPSGVIPLVTWENGKSFTRDGEEGYLTDYAINEVGPSEVAAAQIQEAHKRGFKVYVKADTFASWQFGTFPYLPIPYQWYARYQGLEKAKVDGVLETWSYGFKPNFVANIRAWYCWTDAPPLDDLLRKVARQEFGTGSEEAVLTAWKDFSDAIRLVPDTRRLNSNSIGCPFFFDKPQPRTMTLNHSFQDPKLWSKASNISPYWPYMATEFILLPDFSNQINVAERYARPFSLPVFNKYLLLAADDMERGLQSYRNAALIAPGEKRYDAYREVLIAEQMQRMMRSEAAVLEFEDLRYRLHHTEERDKQKQMLDRMAKILRDEITRTQSSFETARRDSRLGYEWEEDYVYTPHVLQEKLAQLHEVLEKELPAYRRSNAIS